ncbi:MAG: type II toxin-antitoxin system YafQ family toxin [Anaerolineaceae bacterium]|mgnify:CR=1 FL=1|jgi:mRNA interferase YafQ
MKYSVKFTSQFKKDLKLAKRRGLDETKFVNVLEILTDGECLPEQYHDHALSGVWSKHRECHIEPDWLLIYFLVEDTLILTLVRTGSHSDLFT